MARYVALGFRFIQTGTDLSLLMAAARERAAAARAMTPRA
jgi:2-keto-3-deoxy-L-rhamnonate aldolase RhmA